MEQIHIFLVYIIKVRSAGSLTCTILVFFDQYSSLKVPLTLTKPYFPEYRPLTSLFLENLQLWIISLSPWNITLLSASCQFYKPKSVLLKNLGAILLKRNLFHERRGVYLHKQELANTDTLNNLLLTSSSTFDTSSPQHLKTLPPFISGSVESSFSPPLL